MRIRCWTLLFACAFGGALRLWVLRKEGSSASQRNEISASIDTAIREKPTVAKTPQLAGQTPVGRLVSLTEWAATAATTDFHAWLDERPECSPLEWQVLLVRWSEIAGKTFDAEAHAFIQDDAPFTTAVLDQIHRSVNEEANRLDADIFLRHPDTLAEVSGARPGLRDAFEAWLRADWETATHAVAAMDGEWTRAECIAVLVQAGAHVSPEKTLTWITESMATDRSTQLKSYGTLINTLKGENHQEAWAFLTEHTAALALGSPEELQQLGIRPLVERMAYDDPHQVLDWIASLENMDVMKAQLGNCFNLLKGWKDPQSWLERVPPGEARDAMASGMLAIRYPSARERIDVMKTWEGLNHDRVLANILNRSQLDYHSIVSTTDAWKHLPKEETESVVNITLAQWAEQDSREAYTWLQNLPPSIVSPSHYQTLWRRWVNSDPRTASQELAEMPPGPLRDGAIRSLIERVALRNAFPDYEAAWHWTQAIDDHSARETLQAEVRENWHAFDAQAASTVIDHDQ